MLMMCDDIRSYQMFATQYVKMKTEEGLNRNVHTFTILNTSLTVHYAPFNDSVNSGCNDNNGFMMLMY